LDTQLGLLAVEGGAVRAAPELDRLRDRVAAVVEGCADLRAGVRGRAPALHDTELDDLRDACRIEASALRAGPLAERPRAWVSDPCAGSGAAG
ncbi:MAG: hypothetical protein ACRDPK_12315, partial [Carbonactinosporaceae bacterium]